MQTHLVTFHLIIFFLILISNSQGLCLVMQSFVGEVPFFLLSERIVAKIGVDHSLSMTLAAISLRYLSYGFFIKKGYAYYVLIIEMTQGPTFGLFYVVMTHIAQDYSLKAVIRDYQESSRAHNHIRMK